MSDNPITDSIRESMGLKAHRNQHIEESHFARPYDKEMLRMVTDKSFYDALHSLFAIANAMSLQLQDGPAGKAWTGVVRNLTSALGSAEHADRIAPVPDDLDW